jgi:hypothetical protein
MGDFIEQVQCDELDDYYPNDQDWADYNEYLYMQHLAEKESLMEE